MSAPLKIVSGGQTGADIAALDWAISRGLPHGGWCPRGRKAENGIIPSRYNLQETESEDYAERTERNVVESDGTVIFTIRDLLEGGSRYTWECAIRHNKPVLHLHSGLKQPGRLLADFILEHRIRILNVAGPRASAEPTVGSFVQATLEEAWTSYCR